MIGMHVLSYDDAWNACFFFWKAKIIYIRIDKVPDRANLDLGMHVFPFHYDDPKVSPPSREV